MIPYAPPPMLPCPMALIVVKGIAKDESLTLQIRLGLIQAIKEHADPACHDSLRL
jgi:hypothetical protein